MNKYRSYFRYVLGVFACLALGSVQKLGAQTLTAFNDLVVRPINSGSYAFDPTANDTVKGVPNLQFNIVYFPTNANVIQVGQTLTYTTKSNVFQGRDTLRYELVDLDGIAPTSKGVVYFQIGKVSLKPTSFPDSALVGQNNASQSKAVTTKVLANDVITSFNYMQVKITDIPKNGSAVVVNNNITYQPNANFFGRDTLYYALVDTFTFEQDGKVLPSDTSFLVVYVNQIHKDTATSVLIDTLYLPNRAITLSGLLDGYEDLEKDILFLNNLNLGTDWKFNQSTKSVLYTTPNAIPGLRTLTYKVCDTLGNCQPDSIQVFVKAATTVVKPILVDPVLNLTASFGQTMIVNFQSADVRPLKLNGLASSIGSNLTASNFSSITNQLSFNIELKTPYPKSTYFYTLDVKICEETNSNNCNIGQVKITFLDPASKPIAVVDKGTGNEGEKIILNVLRNDTYTKNKDLLKLVTQPLHGKATLDTINGELSYEPFANFNGKDSLLYSLTGNGADSAYIVFTVVQVFNPKVIQGVSPDGDGLNEVFAIEDVDYKTQDVIVKIFNRWGTLIFEDSHYNATDPQHNWNGQAPNGQKLIDGTYFYMVEIPSLKFKESDYLVLINNN
jgi:gliding motility-associated-like protein